MSMNTSTPAVDAKTASTSVGNQRNSEVFAYEAPWLVYGLNWSCRGDHKFRLAIGSFVEEYNNKVEIIELDQDTGEFKKKGEFAHPYPPTKIMWNPDKHPNTSTDYLATTGDYLRLWAVNEDGSVKPQCHALLNNNKNSEFCAPLTSFDWNTADPNIIGTSSIDTTCTIWDIETQQAKTQLIAHDKEVYDIAFAPDSNIFASVGADGSMRMFDLRTLEHSHIIYESPKLTPLLRLAWNTHDHNYLATFEQDSNEVILVDTRVPSMPVATLTAHGQAVNSIAWAPHSSCHLCTGGDDAQALIWDITALPKPINEPMLAYQAKGEINTLQWSSNQPEWVAIALGREVQILRV